MNDADNFNKKWWSSSTSERNIKEIDGRNPFSPGNSQDQKYLAQFKLRFNTAGHLVWMKAKRFCARDGIVQSSNFDWVSIGRYLKN